MLQQATDIFGWPGETAYKHWFVLQGYGSI